MGTFSVTGHNHEESISVPKTRRAGVQKDLKLLAGQGSQQASSGVILENFRIPDAAA
jgi:hypothetical protein